MSHLESAFVAAGVVEGVSNRLFVVNHSTSHIEMLVQDTDHNNWYRKAGEIKVGDEAGVEHPITVASVRISGAVFKGRNDGEQYISIFFVRDDTDHNGNILVLTEVRGLVTAQKADIEWEFGKFPAIATHKSAQIVATSGPDGLPSVMIPSTDHYGKVVVTTMKDKAMGSWSVPRVIVLVGEGDTYSSMVQ